MNKVVAIITVVLAFYLISCSPSRDRMLGNISKMEKELNKTPKVDSNAVNSLLGAYQSFAAKYPKDSAAPECLYKAAGMAVSFHKGLQAVDLYESIMKGYPAYKKIPECYFMEAFAYENVLGNIGKASEYYNKFLFKFPNHALVKDAEAAIKYLGKTPEEMVREFEKMNGNSAKGNGK